MIDQEAIAIEILVGCGKVTDPYGSPVQAVGQRLGIPTADARSFVIDTMEKGLVEIRKDARRVVEGSLNCYPPASWWQKPQRAV